MWHQRQFWRKETMGTVSVSTMVAQGSTGSHAMYLRDTCVFGVWRGLVRTTSERDQVRLLITPQRPMNNNTRHEHFCNRCGLSHACHWTWCAPYRHAGDCPACESLDRARVMTLSVDALAELQEYVKNQSVYPESRGTP